MAKLKIAQLFRFKILLEIISPMVAVFMAFVVGAIIILLFIKSYALTDTVLVDLTEKGVPTAVIDNLGILKIKDYPNKSDLLKDLKSTIGDRNYAQYGTLIAAQPTRGIDVGSIEFIHQRLLQARNNGKAVLLISADLEEVLSISDRIAVMYEGRIVGTLSPEEATEARLGLMMTGGGA